MTKSETGTFDPWRITLAARDVLAERKRQVEAEGWTPEHDDSHNTGEMALAACCYASPNLLYVREDRANQVIFTDPWPWAEQWDRRQFDGNVVLANVDAKPDKRRRMLVKAGALILAEIERLDRAAGLVNVPPSDVPSEDGESDAAFRHMVACCVAFVYWAAGEGIVGDPALVTEPELIISDYCDAVGDVSDDIVGHVRKRLGRRAVSPPDAYRAELMRGAEIAEERCEHCKSYTGLSGGACENCMNSGLKYHEGEVAKAIRAEAAAPPPDFTTPYTLGIVDMPDGYSELMLEDVPRYFREVGGTHPRTCKGLFYAHADDRFIGVRWPTRKLPAPQMCNHDWVKDKDSPAACCRCGAPQPDAAPEPVAWQVKDYADGWITHTDRVGAVKCAERNARSQAEDMGAILRPLYAVPPAPVPAGAVTEIVKKMRAAWASDLADYQYYNGPRLGGETVLENKIKATDEILAALAAREPRSS